MPLFYKLLFCLTTQSSCISKKNVLPPKDRIQVSEVSIHEGLGTSIHFDSRLEPIPWRRSAQSHIPKRVIYYRQVSKNLTTKADREEFATQRYGERGRGYLAKLEHLNRGSLITDPAIIASLDVFLDFASTHSIASANHGIAFRQAYRTTVYRALALSSDGLEVIKTRGIESRFVRAQMENFNDNLPQMFYEHVHESLENPSDLIMSVSYDPTIALAAASAFLKADQDIYLFEINLPTVDVLGSVYNTDVTSDHFFRHPVLKNLNLSYFDDSLYEKHIPLTNRIESFIIHSVEPNEIQRVWKIEDKNRLINLSASLEDGQPVFKAIYEDDTKTLQGILDSGVSTETITCDAYPKTLLQEALSHNARGAIRILLDAGASTDWIDLLSADIQAELYDLLKEARSEG